MRDRRPPLLFACCLAGCYTAVPVEEPPPPGVVFTFPVDNQRDVPLGARLLVSYSDAIADKAGCTVAGPDGNVEITTQVVGHGKTVAITSSAFVPLTSYQVSCGAGGELAGEPLFRFTTRNDRPLAGPPSLIAINGSDPATPGAFRPIFESSTLQIVFSEPLDPRSVTTENGALDLVDANGQSVPATLVANGIHVALDPIAPLAPGATYQLRFGDQLVDLGGERFALTAIAFTPVDSIGRAPIRQVFRTWQSGDPVASVARTDDMNVMAVNHPLIGEANAAMKPNVLETELGDPLALDGPIAFRIPKGQRLTSSSLAIQLAGAIPSGLATGDIAIEMLTDGGGRLYRNRYRPADTIPDNTTSPLLVDLSFDLAIYATDPTGNAVLAQTALGIQLSGLAIADEGALAIETLGALDINLLGINSAPTNIVLDLISDLDASGTPDVQPPALLSSLPAADSHDLIADEGIELLFDEPVDIDRARAGAITLRDGNDIVPSSLEIHGSVIVVRPRATLLGNHGYHVDLNEVTDLAGNAMPLQTFAVTTQLIAQTDVPPSVAAVYPGAPCSLVDVKQNTAGRCAGGASADDRYRPFALAANERIAVVFDQPLHGPSLTLGGACSSGSVRIERVDAQGACVEAVPGTLLKHQRDIAFIPDGGWRAGEHYQLRLVAGGNATCDLGEVCGANGRPANFDPLGGTTASGGPDLLVSFVGTAPTKATTLLATASPNTDLNGSGRMEQGEQQREDNRVALRIAGTSGLITSASFQGTDCVPSTPAVESCMYVLGAIPAQLGERRDNCILPDGTTAATCVPVTMSAQAMYSTSVTMTAGALGILPITTETGMSVMRVRERANGPLEGFIVDRNGTPTMVVALDLYMDAPDMSLPIAQHDMHSKPLSVKLEGPLQFRPDGRIAITLRNTAEVPISVGINAPLGIQGAVKLVVPAGEMRLQLMSRAQRGSLP